MLRSLAVALFAFPLFALPVIGCSPNDDHHHGYVDVDRTSPACGAITTCGACTPVMGCGWCQYEDGKGRCATGPDACGTQPFRWNWDPDTCPVSGDAGFTDAASPDAIPDAIVPAEASTDDAAAEAASESGADAGEDAATAETATDAGEETAVDSGVCKVPEAASTCAPTTGGTLCKAGQYTLGCHGGTPDSSLKCEKALSVGSDTYHCCPCGT
jgi:hypothetical protein